MSLYDDEQENPLLVRPGPFWEEKPVAIAEPPVAPPAAPPPEVIGQGYASPEEFAAKAAPPPEVVGQGYDSPEDVPTAPVKPPEVVGPGYSSPEEAAKPESLLSKAAKFGLATVGLSVPNIGQAKAVLEPETQKAAIDVAEGWKKDLQEAPANLSDYWQKMKTRWAMGKEQATDDQLAYKAATGEVRWEDIKDQLEPSPEAQKAKGEHWYSEGLLQATEMVPAMLDSLLEGSKQGLQWGGAAAGATAIAGQLGPQVALPEELATVPLAAGAGYAGGQAYGSFEYWRRQGTGSLYNDLRKEGIGHEVAKNVSATFGVPYAGIEFLQLTKLVPGMKQAASHAIGEGIKKRLIALGKEKLGEYGEQIGQETSQELMQATSEALAEWKEGVTPPPEKKGIWERAWNTIVQTSQAMPFLMGPKTVTDVTGAVVGERAIAAAQPPPVIAPPVVPPGASVAPPVTPPGVTITPTSSGEVPGAPLPTPPEAFAPSAAPPPIPFQPGQEVTGPVEGAAPGTVTSVEPDGKVLVDWQDGNAPQAMAPEHLSMVIEPDSAGKTVATKVQTDNQQVQQIAAEKSQVLQASAAPKTAQAIQQVAQRSNTEASVTAAEFLRQAQAANNAPPLPEVAAPAPSLGATASAPVTGDERFAPPAAPAQAPTLAAQASTLTAQAPTPSIAVGGQVFTGPTHADAIQAAQAAVGPDAIHSAETGWVDPETGQFSTHAIYDAHVALNTAIEQSGGNMEAPAVQQAQAQMAQAHVRNAEINSQIVQPGAEQAVPTGVSGQAAVVSPRPSQELATPLAGVNVMVEGVSPAGEPVVGKYSAAQALNEARNEKTVLTILLDCIT